MSPSKLCVHFWAQHGSFTYEISAILCVSRSGYTGQHCELDIDECASNPCHYGTCKDGLASFSCQCKAGYTGRLCETNINECLSQPCQNGGTCQDSVNAYRCLCPKGTSGKNAALTFSIASLYSSLQVLSQ